MPALLRIEIVYALPERQHLLTLEVPVGTTLQAAIDHSGILASGEVSAPAAVGIFGRLERDPAARILNDGDRIELYRPLVADAKDIRRRRAKRRPRT